MLIFKKKSMSKSIFAAIKKSEHTLVDQEIETLTKITNIIKVHQINYFRNSNNTNKKINNQSTLQSSLRQMETELKQLLTTQTTERDKIYYEVKILNYIL